MEETTVAATVITRAPATTGVVQMFDAMTVDANVIALIPTGERCTVLEDAQAVQVEGVSMRFYKVKWHGHEGYVNAKWVGVE